ncbi:MAG: alpha/beta hydrolase [SAR202 cluster bacterium]|nr:alpha/beta hydrolase [SAR202 cluster bacterium]
MASETQISYVLVHGTNAGGWCWRKVANILRAEGHQVFTPTLTGCGERSHLMSSEINLDTHIADVVNVIKWEQLSSVVLCGHSSGGWVISGVVEKIPELIKSIVYLDAFLPENGQTAFEMQSPQSREAVLVAKEAGEISRPPGSMERYNINPNDREWFESLATAQPIGTSLQPIVLTGAIERVSKKTYIRATAYPHPYFQAYYDSLKNDPSWRLFELECGHIVMADKPEELTGILLEVA